MPLPTDIYGEDRNYRLRLCIRVEENPVVGIITESVIHLCDRCEEPIWVNERQAIPEPPNGEEVHGDYKLCFDCLVYVYENDPDPQAIEWLDQLRAIREEQGR